MGYSFTFEKPPHDGCNFNIWQMQFLRLIMLEAGVVRDEYLEQALKVEGLEPTEQSVDMAKFQSNDGWHITAEEASFIAARMRLAVEHDVPGELVLYLDEAPPAEALVQWVEEFADFNERATAHGGYRVR
ncbi:hypothetical protein [Streptosporangium sp. NPDC001681]|uniref:hypothetical protein n=1 Tax=Streptosporangium sp. NPDC001681 TaxID=3154395 RepID=UPI00331FF882